MSLGEYTSAHGRNYRDKCYEESYQFSESKHLICAGVNDQYLVVTIESTLEVDSISEITPVQKEEAPQQILFVVETDSLIIYSTTNTLYSLHHVPLNDQINRLLLECKIHDAHKLLEKNWSQKLTPRHNMSSSI